MKRKILFINACTRTGSRTYELANHLTGLLDGEVSHVDLYNLKISLLDADRLEKRDENVKTGNLSVPEFEYAKQFAAADVVVIAAPFWDLSFPAILKVYLENIAIAGITFEYSQQGYPIGKCNAKKLYYITTSGGYIGNNNFGYDYVKALSENFFGIKEVCFYSAEGLDILGADIQAIMRDAKERITNSI